MVVVVVVVVTHLPTTVTWYCTPATSCYCISKFSLSLFLPKLDSKCFVKPLFIFIFDVLTCAFSLVSQTSRTVMVEMVVVVAGYTGAAAGVGRAGLG